MFVAITFALRCFSFSQCQFVTLRRPGMLYTYSEITLVQLDNLKKPDCNLEKRDIYVN